MHEDRPKVFPKLFQEPLHTETVESYALAKTQLPTFLLILSRTCLRANYYPRTEAMGPANPPRQHHRKKKPDKIFCDFGQF